MKYFDASNEREWIYVPYFDLYDLCERIRDDVGNFDVTITGSEGLADNVMTAVDSLVVYSFAGMNFDFNTFTGTFTNGKNGIHIFCPDGDRSYTSPTYGVQRHWYFQGWYNSIDIDENINDGYGNLAWCADDAAIGNNTVENWFEMLDYWFDTSNTSSGGLNYYQY
jgi:clostripain